MDVRALALLVLVVASIASAIPHSTVAPVKVVEASPDYVPITIFERSGNDLVNYPVRVVLNESNFNDWDKVSSGGSDVYFTDSNGKPLYYWIESFDTTAKTAVMWVVVNVTKHGSTTVRMHYGGLNQYPGYRDPSKVFIFFDDFNTLDTNVWKIVKTTSGTVSASNGYLTFSIPSSTARGGVWIAFNNGMDIDGFVVEIRITQFSGYQVELYVLNQSPSGNPYTYYPHLYLLYYDGQYSWEFRSDIDSTYWWGESTLPPTVIGVGMSGSLLWSARLTTWDYNYETDQSYLNIEDMHALYNMKYVAVGIYTSRMVTSATIDWIRIRKAVFPPPSAYVGTPPTVEYIKLCFKADFNGGALTYTLSWSGGANPLKSFTFVPSGQETYVPDGRGGFSLVAVDDSAGRRYGRLDVELNPMYVGFMKVSFKVKTAVGGGSDQVHMVRIELAGDGASDPYYIDIRFDDLVWAYGYSDMMSANIVRLDYDLVELEFAGGFAKLMINKYLVYASYVPYRYNISKVSIIAHEDTSVPPPTEGYVILDDLSISVNNNYCWATYEEGDSYFKYEIDIRTAKEGLTNYPVRVVLNESNFNGWDRVSSGGSDVYFTDSNGNPLYYWVESFDATAKTAVMWVKVPYIPIGGNVTVQMHYGGANPYTSYRDPKNVFPFFEDFESGLSGWSFSGDAGWITTTTRVYEGSYAATNDDIDDSQTACIYRQITVSSLSVITFYWSVSSESGYDFLRFYIDGTEMNKISGEVDWAQEQYILTAGTHEIKWCYTKDASVSAGLDAGFVDSIIVKPYIVAEPAVTVGFGSQSYAPITIVERSGKDLINYPVKVVLDASNFNHFNYIAPDGSNIFFIDQSGKPLNYWIEEVDLRNYNTITVGLIPYYTEGNLTYIKLKLGTGEVISGSNLRLENGIWKADFDYDLIRGKPITKVMVDTYIESPVVILWGDGDDIIFTMCAVGMSGTEVDLNYIMRFPYVIAWVSVPYIPVSGSVKIYMYCGNLRGLNIPRGENNPYKVFPFFEGFDSPTSLYRTYIPYRIRYYYDINKWVYIDGFVVDANVNTINGFVVYATIDRSSESYAVGAKIELGGFYETNLLNSYTCDAWIALGLAWMSEGEPLGYVSKYYAPCSSSPPAQSLELYPGRDVLADTIPTHLGSWNRIEVAATWTTISSTLNDWFVASANDMYLMKLYGIMVLSSYTIGRVDYVYLRPFADPDPVVSVEFVPPVTATTPTTSTPPSHSLLTVTVSFPIMFNISIPTFTAPSFQVSSPSLYTPYGLFTFLLFLGIFVIYSRVFSVAQALTVASAVCLALSLVMLGYSYVFMFLLLFALGLTLWKVLGK